MKEGVCAMTEVCEIRTSLLSPVVKWHGGQVISKTSKVILVNTLSHVPLHVQVPTLFRARRI